jgi:flagellar basal body-associated protein FliL
MSANDKPAKRTKAFSKKGLALWVMIVILTILTVIAMVWAGNQPDFSEPTKPLSDVATNRCS